jgi:DNA-binding NarL/FixJ family response regulator
VKILLCDDHVLFCEALRAALEPSSHQVRTCFRPDDAVALAAAGGYDAVVMDLGFPQDCGLDAVDAIRHIVESAVSTAVVVLSASPESGRLLSAVQAGAVAVCSKSQRLHEIVSVVQRVAVGRSVPVQAHPMSRPRAASLSDEGALADFLTPREYEVLRRLVAGQSTQSIAAEMGVSYSTSRTHIQNVLVKLGVHSRLAASAFAVRHHLVDDDLLARVPSQPQPARAATSGSRVLVRRDRVSD